MSNEIVTNAWRTLVNAQRDCRDCCEKCSPPLIEDLTRSLFGKFEPWGRGLLFVFEAPNHSDTFDSGKGYLTYDQETDPTGRFARVLMTEELGLNPRFFQVTNSVLCLPRDRRGKRPVSVRQVALCSTRIRDQILTL
jgi:hypothetical protein